MKFMSGDRLDRQTCIPRAEVIPDVEMGQWTLFENCLSCGLPIDGKDLTDA